MVKGLSYALGQIGSQDIVDGTVIASELGTDAVTTIKISGLAVTASKLKFAGVGSPTGFGLNMQAGSATASDVNVVVTFGTAFAGVPRVVISANASGAVATMGDYVVGASAGSFVFFGQSGLAYNYFALGSGGL